MNLDGRQDPFIITKAKTLDVHFLRVLHSQNLACNFTSNNEHNESWLGISNQHSKEAQERRCHLDIIGRAGTPSHAGQPVQQGNSVWCPHSWLQQWPQQTVPWHDPGSGPACPVPHFFLCILNSSQKVCQPYDICSDFLIKSVKENVCHLSRQLYYIHSSSQIRWSFEKIRGGVSDHPIVGGLL